MEGQPFLGNYKDDKKNSFVFSLIPSDVMHSKL